MISRTPSTPTGPLVLGLALLAAAGCASPPGADFERRRSAAEQAAETTASANPALIEARRAELEAAVAREGDSPLIDSVEIRTTATHEVDDRVEVLARLPLDEIFVAPAKRAARRAQSEAALAKLETATLEQRVALCLPSVETLVYREHQALFEGYAERVGALDQWNAELRSAGQIDEVSATRFEIQTAVNLATRSPSAPAALEDEHLVTALPALPGSATETEASRAQGALAAAPDLLRRAVEQHQPELRVHQATRRRFEALARRARIEQLPALRFVDIGYEALPFPGDTAAVEARASIEIPFGLAARANEKRYGALGREQRSRERALMAARTREAAASIAEINAFRNRAPHWSELLSDAQRAEQVAERWQAERLTGPSQISNLLQEVYDARVAVLEARARAGRSGCALLAATGVPPEHWPQSSSDRP